MSSGLFVTGDDSTGAPEPDDSEPNGTTGTEPGEASSSDTGQDEALSNIARVGMTGGFVDQGAGVWTLGEAALAEAGHAFYASHGDDYDFIALYTEGEILEFWATAYSVQGGIGGVGWGGVADPAISPATVGSAGRLLQINVMNAPHQYEDPNDASIVVHETTHHWSAFIELPGTPTSGYLLDDSFSHWNIHVDTGGPSATGYGALVDLGGGVFSFTVQYPLRMSALELYLAGFMPADEVPPLFYVRDASGYDPPMPAFGGAWNHASYGLDASFAGTRVDFTVDDVIASNGARTPAFGDAQTEFRFAFVLVCVDVDACDPAELAGVEAQRIAFEAQFPIATGGRATVHTEL